MTTRVLPPEEWPKLDGTELERVWPLLDPQEAHVLVVEDGRGLVACWAAIHYWHLEGLWIRPDARKRASAGRRIWIGMRRLMQHLGVSVVLTGAMSDEVRDLLAHVGATKLPGDHYVVPMKER